MKNSIPIVFCFIAACTSAIAQDLPLKNYSINHTGYSSLFPANPGKAEVSLSDNELEVYTSEVEYNEIRYGLAMVLLEDKFINSDKETLQSLLVSYMHFLKLSHDITSSIGYVKGQKHPANSSATGIIDFWEDERGAQWAVKGWINNDVLAVLYVYSNRAQGMPVPDAFLDGFVFKKLYSPAAGSSEKAIKVLPRNKNLK